jgi:hypothetical protein
MADATVGPIGWERALMAAEKVKERLRRATRALDDAGIPYAVAGGNAVAEWVGRVDEDAVRNTKDVDLLIRRPDLSAVLAAAENPPVPNEAALQPPQAVRARCWPRRDDGLRGSCARRGFPRFRAERVGERHYQSGFQAPNSGRRRAKYHQTVPTSLPTEYRSWTTPSSLWIFLSWDSTWDSVLESPSICPSGLLAVCHPS